MNMTATFALPGEDAKDVENADTTSHNALRS